MPEETPPSFLSNEEIDLVRAALHHQVPYLIRDISRTQFSIARHYGGCDFKGFKYVYDPLTDELIRQDVLKLVMAHRRKLARQQRRPADTIPLDLTP